MGALGLTLALSHATVFAQARPNANGPVGTIIGNSAAAIENPVDDGLPKKKPRPIRNEDGTPAGDAASGIAPDPEVALPTAGEIKKPAHRKHRVSRGEVHRKSYPTAPQPLISTLR
jgi:hypothetical protein